MLPATYTVISIFYVFSAKGSGYNSLQTFGLKNKSDKTNSQQRTVSPKNAEAVSRAAVNGNIMTASTIVTSLDEECTTMPVSQLMLQR